MKLYNPNLAKQFVFAVCPKGYKEGTKPSFVASAGADTEIAEQALATERLVNVYPHAMGRYDEEGFYCPYTPPIEGIKPGKFVRHPLAHQAKVEFDKELLTKRYGAGVAA